MIDYRKLRLSNITSPQFKHLFLLIFWPLFGLIFWLLERGLTFNYYPIEVAFDNKIPFCEYFIIPYYFWFVFLVGIHIYTLLFDIPAFKKLMYFIIITYTVTSVIYILFPNKQELRPIVFERNNIFTDIVKYLYSFDTNTNVCPSLHVIGSFSVLFTSLECDRFKGFWWKSLFIISTILISISTIFLKQHSIVDIIVALLICFVAYPISYILPDKIRSDNNISLSKKET